MQFVTPNKVKEPRMTRQNFFRFNDDFIVAQRNDND